MYIHTPQEAMYGFLYTFLQMGQNTFIIFDLSPASTTTSCMVCMQGNDTMNGMSCLPRGLIKQTLFQETRTEAHVCTCTWDQLCEVGVYTEVRGGNDGHNMRKSEGMPPSPHAPHFKHWVLAEKESDTRKQFLQCICNARFATN